MRHAVTSLLLFALIRQALSQPNEPAVLSFIATPNPASFGQPFTFGFNRLQTSTDGSDPTALAVQVFFTSATDVTVDDAPKGVFNITIGTKTSGTIMQDSSGTPLYKLDQFDGIGEYDVQVFTFDAQFQGDLRFQIEKASSTSSTSKTIATTTGGTGNGGTGNTQTGGGTTQTSDPQGSASSDPSATSTTNIGSSTVSSSGSAIQAPSSSSSGGAISPGTSSDPGLGPASSTSVISTDSSTTPSPSSTQNAATLIAASHNRTGAIAGGVVGGVIALLLLIGGVILLRRRLKSSRDLAELHANRDVEPYDVGYGTSVGIIPGKRPVTPTSDPLFPSDQKSSVPVNTARGEKRPTNPVLPVSSEDSQLNSSSPSNVQSLPATAAVPMRQSRPQSIVTERQFQLQEREERNLRELATLEERIAAEPGTGAEADLLSPSGANEGDQDMVMVARSEHEATRAEMRRLREENTWLRDAQQSDWAMGLSDEMPPPYQGRMDEG